MPKANTPKDNVVLERFIRIFKEHKISNKTFQEELFHQIKDNAQFKRYGKVFNVYIKDINFKLSKKAKTKSSEYLDAGTYTASLLMKKLNYSKLFLKYYGQDFRRDDINKYKLENNNVINILIVQKAKIVDKILFDFYKTKKGY